MSMIVAMQKHHFTIDVEEYYQVSAFESVVERARWDEMESRVVPSTDRLLAMLGGAEARATCFVLGCVATRHPKLVRRIADAGHEVASHGWDHKRITEITPTEFRQSVRDSKRILEDLSGQPVLGFRAPSFSIVQGREWALEILVEEGYAYDSSLFPIRRSKAYGYAGGERDPHWLKLSAGNLAEFPPSTVRLGSLNLPAAGGGYFRLLPPGLVHAGLRQCARRGVPGTFYIHPWELDPDQPRLRAPLRTRVRHYTGLRATEPRIAKLLHAFRFQPIAETLRSMKEVSMVQLRAPSPSTATLAHSDA
jgi:polysaccharide deacetylase family protein (PEP-CTERM system associated)